MEITLNEKTYPLAFDNYSLHEWGELCGFETFNNALRALQGFAEVANGKELTIAQSKQLAKLCYVALDKAIEEREVFNLMFSNLELIKSSLVLALDSLPKPHREDRVKKKEVAEVK